MTKTEFADAPATGIIATCVVESPVGPLTIRGSDVAITHVLFGDSVPNGGNALLDEAGRQLSEYFAGRREEFDLPLNPRGTAFQRRVWAELLAIPFASTASYGQMAARLGLPRGASRAVGLANGANPIAIVVPCHRVIGANGTLTGYAGGLPRKRFLLDLESRARQEVLFAG